MAIFNVTNLAELQDAITSANSNGADDTINLASGTYRLVSTLTILSDSGHSVTFDGDANDDGVADALITGDVSNDDITVGGITDIFNTAATELDDNVGIFSVTGADLTLDGLTLTGGQQLFGGAVSTDASLTLLNTTVSGNRADGAGGGISAQNLNLTNSTVSGNSSSVNGGGIYAATANLINSTVSGNSAVDQGGGIFVFLSATLDDSTVSGNSADGDGGGIEVMGSATLTNSTVSGNSADGAGGGIHADTATTLTNSTISGNSAGIQGGGIFTDLANLTNSIVLGNNATEDAEISGTIVKTGGNIVGGDVFQGSTDVGDTTVADVFAATVDIDPSAGTVFAGVLADNGGSVQTIALKSSGRNPALDASNANAPTTDARGEARFDQTTIANTNGSAADLGAYEVRTLVGVAITGNAKANVINATHTLAGQPLPGGGDDFISGRGGNDRISALDGDDTIIGGKGVDKMRGGDGADIFQFNSLAELKTIQVVTVGSVPTHKVLFDHIMDFAIGDDQLDFGNIDANRTASGKQDFTLIGSSKFSGDAGELRFVNKAGGAVVLGDVNGDGKADFKLVLDHATIAADDFILA